MKLMNTKNLFPNIIVIWSKENEACKYYIDVKKMLISVSTFEVLVKNSSIKLMFFFVLIQIPDHYTAVQTFDMFFKVSKVFNIDLHKCVTPLFRVFEKYVYGMDVKQHLFAPKHLEDAELLFKDK